MFPEFAQRITLNSCTSHKYKEENIYNDYKGRTLVVSPIFQVTTSLASLSAHLSSWQLTSQEERSFTLKRDYLTGIRLLIGLWSRDILIRLPCHLFLADSDPHIFIPEPGIWYRVTRDLGSKPSLSPELCGPGPALEEILIMQHYFFPFW